MKKVLGFLLVLCLLLCGCGKTNAAPGVEVLSNDQYSVMDRDGEYYFDFKEDVDLSGGGQQTGAANPGSSGVNFGSVKAMHDRIVNGGFSAATLSGMAGWAKTTDGKVAVCNVNALWDAYLPQDLSVAHVNWCGQTYAFVLQSDDLEGRLCLTTESGYQRMKEIYEIEETNNLKFTSVEQVAERDATVITYESQVASSGKQIRYTYEKDGFTVTILENYFFDYSETETVPFIVNGMAEGNGIYYYWSVGGFTERPSYEWIKSIGLKPYTETKTE